MPDLDISQLVKPAIFAGEGGMTISIHPSTLCVGISNSYSGVWTRVAQISSDGTASTFGYSDPGTFCRLRNSLEELLRAERDGTEIGDDDGAFVVYVFRQSDVIRLRGKISSATETQCREWSERGGPQPRWVKFSFAITEMNLSIAINQLSEIVRQIDTYVGGQE